MRRRLLCLLFLCFVSVFFFPPAAHAEGSEPTLQALSAKIHTQLDGLRQQSRHLTEQLLVAENELRTSSRQVEALQTELRDLNGCLENTNRKLGEYSLRDEAQIPREGDSGGSVNPDSGGGGTGSLAFP